MLEAYGNIWDLAPDYDAIVITTNGFVKKNGEAVMGRGIAKEAKERFPTLPEWLGSLLQVEGNIVLHFPFPSLNILTMPVKPIVGPNGEPGWKAKAELPLIKESAKRLVYYADWLRFYKIIMPRPGCGNGGLHWPDVKKVIEPILDDRFTVVTFHP